MQGSKLWSHKDHENTFHSIHMHHNLPFLMEKTAKNGHFLVKKCFFWPQTIGSRLPPYFDCAGCKEPDCRDTRITQTQFPASVCTKICYFS